MNVFLYFDIDYSTYEEGIINILKGLVQKTRQHFFSSTPTNNSRKGICWTPTGCEESTTELFCNILKGRIQEMRKGLFCSTSSNYSHTEIHWTTSDCVEISAELVCDSLKGGVQETIKGLLCSTPTNQSQTEILCTPTDRVESSAERFCDILKGGIQGMRKGLFCSTSANYSHTEIHWTTSDCVENSAEWFCVILKGGVQETKKGPLSSTPTNQSQREILCTPTDRVESSAEWCYDILKSGLQEKRRGLLCFTSVNCSRTDIRLTPSDRIEISADFIANMSQVEQTTPDQFLRNVEIFTHMILRREYPLLSYDHHLLVLGFDKVAINVTEYTFPSGFINIASALSQHSLGQIQYRTIPINELFHPGASRVFFAYNEDYPITIEQINAIMERLPYREGEISYSFIYNNCEHFVNYVKYGNPVSIQWRDASTVPRFIGDGVQKIPGVAVNGCVKVVLQKCLTNVQSKQVSVDRSFSVEEECERDINPPAAQNKLCSKLRGVLKIYSIHGRDLLFAMLCSVLMVVIFCLQGGHSPGRYIWIVGIETFLLRFPMYRQLLEILEILSLWQYNAISTVDLPREMFKIGIVYLVYMTKVAGNFSESDSTFRKLFRRCLVTIVSSSFAGLLFDKGYFIINTIFRLL